jgi:hypothetical protein
MMNMRVCGVRSLILTVLASLILPLAAFGQTQIESGKTYRVVRTTGQELVGEVKDLGDSYEIKVGTGIVTTLRKNEVRELIAVGGGDEEGEAGEASDRGLTQLISDADVKTMLGDESVEDLYVYEYVQRADLISPLDTDWDSVEIMKRYAGQGAKVLETPHFVFVYTSAIAPARKLAGRLETVWKWNAIFADMFNIPVQRPDHKLEVYYFKNFDEYHAYQTLNGFMEMNALGFYMRTNNRCAFFDMNTWPPVARRIEAAKDPKLPPQDRLKAKNQLQNWAEWNNVMVVQHEATHAIQFNIGVFPREGDAGKWMTEGLCVQFEVSPGITGGSFGSINYGRLSAYRERYGPKGEAVPWTFVKNMIMSDEMGFEDYVMGWAINYYLRKQFPEKYGVWMNILAARESNWAVRTTPTERLSQFENCFGKLDEEWVNKLKAFIADIPMREGAIVKDPFGP